MQHEENYAHQFPFVSDSKSSAPAKNKPSSSDKDAAPLWSIVIAALESQLDSQLFEAYITPLEPISYDSSTSEFTLAATSKFVIERVERAYGDLIVKTLSDQLNNACSLVFKVDSSIVRATIPSAKKAIVVKKELRPQETSDAKITTSSQAPAAPIISNLNPRYTFSNFVVGNSNQFCHAAARQVSESPGQAYNPLFIYGGVGLGKSHLLHAIGNAILERKPSAKVLYMSSETFTNELIQSLRGGKMDDFKNKLRGLDTLLIDDIQFISGKERTQEEFFHTFNTLHSTKGQIVITSDTVPQEISGLKERLQTRFSWGLIADLQAPDFETRVAILNRKAAVDGFTLPMDVAHFVAENISTNVRELEGALTRLGAISSLQGVRISLALAESVLKPMLKPKIVNITVDDIKRVVSAHFGLKVVDLSSKKRSRSFSFPRHIAMYLCRKHTTCSYPDIGYQFGGRDHSSVIHAANVVGKKLSADIELRLIMSKIESILIS